MKHLINILVMFVVIFLVVPHPVKAQNLTSITISTMPAPKVGISGWYMTNQTNQFYATGHYDDNSTKDITDSCVWFSSNTSLGTISNVGLYTLENAGTHNITATLHSITGTLTIYTRLQSCYTGVYHPGDTIYDYIWYGTSPITSSGCTYVLIYVSGSWASYAPTGVTIGTDNKPEIHQLLQNYPNPFNPTTTIQYSVPRTEFVSLKIYDMLGREITTLVNENVNPGNHIITWDASNQPSGDYFYLFHAGEYSETKRLVLLK